MKKVLRKAVSTVLAVAVLAGGVMFSNVSAANMNAVTQGWKETIFTEWQPVSGAAKYEAYVKGEGDGSYTKLDDELIRQYDTYCRADALGLKAGNYTMRIVALDSAGAELASFESASTAVEAYKRKGFAFSSGGTASGGYKDDGTVEDNAQILYITDATKDTVTADVIMDSKGTTQTCTGVGAIIKAREKQADTRPLIFRFIGEVSCPASEQKLNQLDIKRTGNITFEGVGPDAVTKFGFNLVEAYDTEIRNLGFKDMTTKDEDAVTIKDSSHNIWVHNLDVFYGGHGSDADQAKGDGGVDLKGTSTNITIADNHYWDFGKVNLCGLGESADYNITYSGNWFDHSDSRHPRIRNGSIHIYNNYFDGNAKYGVGMTSGGSAFVENNYFRSCSKPMMISQQGTDGNGDGTFSGDPGGIIKVYNNIMAGTYTYIEGTVKDDQGNVTYNTWADGYSVSTRDEKLPDSLKCTAGGTSYNNFDTTKDLGMTEADLLAPEDVPAYVMKNAGRLNGGNFEYAFNNVVDDTDYNVNSALNSAVSAYTNGIITVGGTVSKQPNTSATPASMTGVDGNKTFEQRDSRYEETAAALPKATEEEGNKATGGGGGTSEADLSLAPSDISVTDISSNVGNLGTNGAFEILANSSKKVTISSSKGIQLGGAGSIEYRAIKVTTEKPGTLYVNGSSTGTDTRTLMVADSTGAEVGTIAAPGGTSVKLPAAGTYFIYSTNKGINVKSVTVVYDKDETGSTSESTTETTTVSTSESTTETTTVSTSESTTETTTESTTEPPVGDGTWGDADMSGNLTSNDAAMILAYTLDPSKSGVSDEAVPYLDVNASGEVDADDAARVLQKTLIWETIFPAEKNK